eukprot:SAG11_NODE_3711_length_2266_cov_20.934472_1_plen_607_part_00
MGTGGLTVYEDIVASTYTEPEGEGNPESQELGSLDPSSSSSSSSSDSDPDDDMGRESGVVLNAVLPSDEQRDTPGLGYVSSQSTEGDENQLLYPDDPDALLEEILQAGMLMLEDKQRDDDEEDEEEEEQGRSQIIHFTKLFELLHEGLFGTAAVQKAFFENIYDDDRSYMSFASITISCAKFVGIQNPDYVVELLDRKIKHEFPCHKQEYILTNEAFRASILNEPFGLHRKYIVLSTLQVSLIWFVCATAFLTNDIRRNGEVSEEQRHNWYENTIIPMSKEATKKSTTFDKYLAVINRQDFEYDGILYSMCLTTNALFLHTRHYPLSRSPNTLFQFSIKQPVFVMRRRGNFVLNFHDENPKTDPVSHIHVILKRDADPDMAHTAFLDLETPTFAGTSIREAVFEMWNRKSVKARYNKFMNMFWEHLFYTLHFDIDDTSMEGQQYAAILDDAKQNMKHRIEKREHAGVKRKNAAFSNEEKFVEDFLLVCDYENIVWGPGTAKKITSFFVEMTAYTTHRYNDYMRKVKERLEEPAGPSTEAAAAASIAAAAAGRKGNKRVGGTGASAATVSAIPKRGSRKVDEESPAQKREAKRKRKEEGKNAKRPKN